MKKILVITMLISMFAIKNTHWADNGSNRHKVYSIQCSNGNNTIIQYFPSSNTYPQINPYKNPNSPSDIKTYFKN